MCLRVRGGVRGVGVKDKTWGYRILRVAGVLTFRCAGAEKLVLKLVGVNYENGQIVLLAG